MTRSRRALLSLLEEAEYPLSVADLLTKLADEFDQATVYRSMHWLTKEGLVEEFAFSCKERGLEHYYVAFSKGHCHFFHCNSCHQFFPIQGCGVDELAEKLEKEQGYSVDKHTLYFTGSCPSCRLATDALQGGQLPMRLQPQRR